MRDETKRIPMLILKRLTGKMTAEEKNELQQWADKAEANEALVKRLTDNENLKRELRRRRAITTRRQMNDMKARIEREFGAVNSITKDVTDASHSTVRSWLKPLIGAAAMAIIIGGAAVWMNGKTDYGHEPAKPTVAKNTETVSHGTTQAVLTFDNGVSIELDADSAANVEAIAKAVEGDEPRTMSLATPRGGEFKVTLEDGTEVWLNAQSCLRYPESFGSNERKVQLEGEAYFKVAKNTEKPFIVESGGQQVRVTGTEFNINSYNEDASIYTTLVNGSIALRPINGNGGELVLRPGNQAVFDKADEHASVRTVDTAVVTSWRGGSFVFEHQTLEQIMVTLSRWYDFEYEFKADSKRNIVFMGSVPRYGEFADVLRILEMSGNIKFELNGKKLAIK